MTWWNPSTWGNTQPKASYGGTLEDEARLIDTFIGGASAGYPTASGVVVNESTAMRVSAVYRCVALLSGTIASLPCEVYRNGKGGKAESATDHPAYYLLHNEACALMTAHQFWRTFLWSAFMHGNGYALISRTALGAPKSLSWIAPHRCTPELNEDKTRLRYRMTLPNGQFAVFDQDDVLHWTFLGWDGTKGMSPMDCARGAIALAVAGQEFNERFFSQGNAADYAFEFPQKFDPEQAKAFYEIWEKNHTGLSKSRMPIIADNGAKVTRLDFKADESQLMESRSFQVEDICRFYGVPPHMVGHTSKSTSWGKAMFGDPTTTGASAPFTHVFKSNNDMPSLVTQAKYGNFFGQYSGCKVSSFAMNAGGDGELTATINMMGKSADFVDTNYDATAELVTMKRFSNFQGALTSGGTSLGVVTAFSLNMDFGLDNSIRPISGGGYVYDLVQGVMAVTGSVTVFITNKNLLTSAKNSTELDVSLSFTIDADNSLVFKLPQVQLSFDGPTIDGPTGIKMDQNYVAYYNGNADNAAVVVTLKNDIASF